MLQGCLAGKGQIENDGRCYGSRRNLQTVISRVENMKKRMKSILGIILLIVFAFFYAHIAKVHNICLLYTSTSLRPGTWDFHLWFRS